MTGAQAPGGDVNGAVARSLTLSRTSIPRTLRVSTLVSKGLPVQFTAPAQTKLVRLQITPSGDKQPKVKVFVKVKSGKSKLRLRQRAIIRALRAGGQFRIELAPGVSKSKLGKKTVKRITIRR